MSKRENTLFEDREYAARIQHLLPGCVKKGVDEYIFRCPICGDSKRNKRKKRGGIYSYNGSLFFKCFNCGASMPFSAFLKTISPEIYREYMFAIAKNRSGEKTLAEIRKTETVIVPKKNPGVEGLESVLDLPETHIAVKVLIKRKIPRTHWDDIYYCKRFGDWAQTVEDSIVPDRFPEHRLIIVFRDRDGSPRGYACRSFSKKTEPRYIMLNPDKRRKIVWGLNKVDPKAKVMILEGAFDAMCLKNAIAVSGTTRMIPTATRFSTIGTDYAIVFDNQPANKEVLDLYEKAIDMGLNVCIWKDVPWRGKDINEMILAGAGREELTEWVNSHIFNGLRAKLEFGQWRRL